MVFATSYAFSLERGLKSEVQSVFVGTDTNARPYVTLKTENSMPGCHADRGGYLYGDSIDKAYSTVLAALRSGATIQVYYQLNANNDGWSKCYIKSLNAY